MSSRLVRSVSASLLILGFSVVTSAEPVVAPRPMSSAEQVRGWIADLGNPDFTTRTEATRALLSEGERIMPLLREATESSDLETATRAGDLLHTFENREIARILAGLEDLDDAGWKSARKRLRELGEPVVQPIVAHLIRNQEGKNEKQFERLSDFLAELCRVDDASLAATAQDGLFNLLVRGDDSLRRVVEVRLAEIDPDLLRQARMAQLRMGVNRRPVAINVQGGNVVQIRVRGGNGRVPNVQQKRSVKVVENGREIRIEEVNGAITVSETVTENGKKKTQTWKGKNREDLKKKSKRAAELVDKYLKPAGVRVIARPAAVPGNIRPVLPQRIRPNAKPQPAPQKNPEQKKALEAIQNEIQAASKELHEAARAGATPDEIRQRIDNLKTLIEQQSKALREK